MHAATNKGSVVCHAALTCAQDTGGDRTPLSYNGKSWIPIGWDKWDASLGYGWCSPSIGLTNPTILFYNTVSAGNVVANTIMYNDYAWRDVFYFAVAPGTYKVTVAVGWGTSCRNGDTEYIQVNGVVVRDFRCNTQAGACCGTREYSATVTVRGNNLLVMNVCPIYECVYRLQPHL